MTKVDPHPLDQASLLVGGRAELAKKLDVTPSAIGNWKKRGVPAEHCPSIEEATGGQVVCERLNPGVKWWVVRGRPLPQAQASNDPTGQQAA